MRVGDRGPEPYRFFSKVEKRDDGCWLWTASRDTAGYGQFWSASKRRNVRASRWAYEDRHGPVPAGHDLRHACGDRRCVNPAHLEPVASGESWRTGNANGAKTHCLHGHPFDEANTYVDGRGRRHCVTCRRERLRAMASDPANREARAAYARERRRRKSAERAATRAAA